MNKQTRKNYCVLQPGKQRQGVNILATEACNKINDFIQQSRLHFVINQTPFSPYITIRGKFIISGGTILDKKAEAVLKMIVAEIEQKVLVLCHIELSSDNKSVCP